MQKSQKQKEKTKCVKLFKAASDAETIHALRHFQVAGKIGSTAENLEDGINGETYEFESMYPPFIEAAEAEGNKAAVQTFTYAMEAEKSPCKTIYKKL